MIASGSVGWGCTVRAMSASVAPISIARVSSLIRSLASGLTIVGPDASDLISELTLAIEMGATLADIALTVHPHPTLPEAIMESAEAALGQAIHVLNR